MALREHLAAFPDLGTLDLMGSQVSNVGIASLPILPSLKVLRLSGTSVTDGLADILPKFPLLAEIWLEKTAVTDLGIAEIKRQCPACAVKH
jgi:internalin A